MKPSSFNFIQCNLQLHNNNNDKTKSCNIFLKKNFFFLIHYLLILYLKGYN